jgi:hypothetical protein
MALAYDSILPDGAASCPSLRSKTTLLRVLQVADASLPPFFPVPTVCHTVILRFYPLIGCVSYSRT